METNRKTKVLYLITKSNWGGAQKYVYDLATHVPNDVEPIVACGGNGLLVKKLQEKGVRVIPLPDAQRDIALFKELKLLITLFRIVRSEKTKILHVNSSKLAGLGAFVGWATRTRTVFTAHGWPFNEDRVWWQKLLIYKFSWLTSLFSDVTITITSSDYEQGRHMWFVGHKMHLIHNAIEQIDFYERRVAREKLGLKESDFVIGTIAELHKNKGQAHLISALVKIKDLDWSMVIISEGEERAQLEHLIVELDMRNRIVLYGQLNEAKLYLKAFDIFTLTSVKEGLPYTLLEAGQAELPVVASNIGGIPDVIGDAGMLVPAKNPELIARALKALIANQKLRKKLGSQLSDRVAKLFSFENFLSKTYELYKG